MGSDADMKTMVDLSGGEKAVVAIALIFAIQLLEPAPFYLFDEIDTHLDAGNGAAVARLIARHTGKAQIVMSTFSPELIEAADERYRVYQENRVSFMQCVTAEQAREQLG